MIAGGQAVERVETPDQAVDAVRRMVLHRADWVKTCHSDRSLCVGKGTLPTLSDPAYTALFAEAAKFGKPVAFHQMWLSAFRKGLQFKPATFEHTPFDGRRARGSGVEPIRAAAISPSSDLVVLEANPIEDIANMGRVRAVYKGGRLV
jgi:imidazolonepropionase-like amidohydrolase